MACRSTARPAPASTLSTAQPHIESGKLIPLASTGVEAHSATAEHPDHRRIGLPRLQRDERAQEIARESATWGRVIRERKITIEQ